MKSHYIRAFFQGLVVGLILAIVTPVIVSAARVATLDLTGLFPSTTLSVNLPAPVISLGNSTTTGSVYSNGGSALYFTVTALDGVGESLVSNLMGTSTVNQAHGWQITWTAVPGASGYRVYFSTSTPQSFTQYFAATTTDRYTFQSTSTPVFIAGIPTENSAYVVNFAASGASWLNGGTFAIGTTSPALSVALQVSSSTATTSAVIGSKGLQGGKWIFVDSVAGHATCSEITTNAGTLTTKAVTCP